MHVTTRSKGYMVKGTGQGASKKDIGYGFGMEWSLRYEVEVSITSRAI